MNRYDGVLGIRREDQETFSGDVSSMLMNG